MPIFLASSDHYSYLIFVCPMRFFKVLNIRTDGHTHVWTTCENGDQYRL